LNPYPTWVVYPQPGFSGPDSYVGNVNYVAPVPQPPQPPPVPDGRAPTYEGKTVAEWARDLKAPDSRVRGEAAAALGHFGSAAQDAVPALIGDLNDRAPAVRVEVTVTLGKIGPDAVAALRDALQSPDRLRRMGAALALGHLGAKAKAAIPDLTALL